MSSQNISEIEDEDLLYNMMSKTDNFDERKKIRGRLRELREKKSDDYDKRRQEREQNREDAIQMKLRQAEADKQRKMKQFDEMAKGGRKDTGQTEDRIREKHAAADAEKQKKMEEFKEMGKVVSKSYHSGSDQITLDHLKKADEDKKAKMQDFNEDAVSRSTKTENIPGGTLTTTSSKTTHTSKDGSTVVTKQTKQVTQVGSVGGTSYNITKTSSGKQQGPRGAMAAFKSMDNASNAGKPSAGRVGIQRSPSAIKEMLLLWIQRQVAGYPNVNVTNFSSSWNDGMAFCALIHHFHPEAFDFNKLDPKRRRANFKLAFDAAEKLADIAPLLEVEDMVRMKNPDWKCVFTYVQSFYRTFRNHDENQAAS